MSSILSPKSINLSPKIYKFIPQIYKFIPQIYKFIPQIIAETLYIRAFRTPLKIDKKEFKI